MWRSLQKQDRGSNKGTEHCNSRCETPSWHTSAISHTSRPFSHRANQGTKISHTSIQGAKFTPVCEISADIPPGGHPLTLWPPTAKAKRPAPRPPAKRTKFSGPGEPSQTPQAEPPTEDSQIPVGIPLETVIRCPMIARPPIEGNLDCRDRSFHAETWFDVEALKQQPELGDSLCLLQRYHMEHLLIPRQFYYPKADFREWSSFSQRDMVRILSRGTSTASVWTRRELPSGMLLLDVLLRANIFPLQHKVQRRGAILEALFRISEGYYFGPHHLIMTSLLHFEEKVHQKKLQRADVIPLLFPRLLCQILEHLGYPGEPRLERRRHCREDFSLDKWYHLAAYFAPQGAPVVPPPQGAPAVPPPQGAPTVPPPQGVLAVPPPQGAPDMLPPPELPQDE
ncbi:hypothetical protein CK203_107856 [Vitis vinifera]|uniref:Uncharacterized protein n=1 Tax=Vitis vinifera TaxID=29760 RepID=A0A438CI48_VITVI|nr:hypothetical protein CK203_107856 [Vitis vinifera]